MRWIEKIEIFDEVLEFSPLIVLPRRIYSKIIPWEDEYFDSWGHDHFECPNCGGDIIDE